MYGVIPLISWHAGGEFSFDFERHQLVLLPAAYYMGALPAFIAAMADSALDRHGVSGRLVWTTLVGFAVCFLPIGGALAMGYLHGPYILVFGLVGAVPAFVCSRLAG